MNKNTESKINKNKIRRPINIQVLLSGHSNLLSEFWDNRNYYNKCGGTNVFLPHTKKETSEVKVEHQYLLTGWRQKKLKMTTHPNRKYYLLGARAAAVVIRGQP
jgi:hypothetical protein